MVFDASQGRAPRVSVVLPVYNRASMLAGAIASVRAQTFEDFELIVVDDGSTDGSREVAHRAAEEDHRIRVLEGVRGGVSAARNRGLEAARGQIVTYLDSDNRWRPRYLEAVVSRLEGRMRATCYAGLEVTSVDAAGRELQRTTLLNDFDAETILFGNQIDINTFAHTIDLYEDLGGFDESMTRLVDWDLILRYTRVAPPERIDDVLADYLDAVDDVRVSVHADYAPNRLRIALNNRLPPVPRVVCFGELPSEELRSIVESSGLVVEHAARSVDLEDALGGRPIVLWTSTAWDDVARNLEAASAWIRRAAGLSVCLVPRGASVAALPGLYRRFDLVALEDTIHRDAFAERVRASQNARTPTNTLLTWRGAGGGTLAYALVLAIAHRHPPRGTRIALSAHDALDRLAVPLSRRGFDTADAADADVTVLGPSDGPVRLDRAGAVGRWVDDEDASIDALATVDFVITTESAAIALAERYAGLRVWGLPSHPERAAQVLAVRLGDLLRRSRPDGIPEYRRPRILYVHGHPDANTTRTRCFEITKAVAGTFDVGYVRYSELSDADVVGRDLVVIQRWASHALERASGAFATMARFRALGKRFVYEIDDFIFDFGDGLPTEFMRAADGVFVSTPALRDLATPYNESVTVVRNAVDADRFFRARQRPLDRTRHHILIASTDGMGIGDLDALVAGVHPGAVTWYFVSAVPDLRPRPNVEYHDVMPIDDLFALTKTCDLVVNLSRPSRYVRETITHYDDATLTAFIDAKSEVKYQLAGLAGVPIVTTASPAIYRDVVRHGENGFMVDDAREMPALITQLLDDAALRHRVAQRARRDVLDHHTLLARRHEYRQAFSEAAALDISPIVHLRPDLWACDHPPPAPGSFEQRQLAAYASSHVTRPGPVGPTTAEALHVLATRIRTAAEAVRSPKGIRRTVRRLLRLVRE